SSEAMKNIRLTGTSDIREIKMLGDWAYVRNYIEITITPPDGTTTQRSGYTLSILHKQSTGKWVLWRDANLVALLDFALGKWMQSPIANGTEPDRRGALHELALSRTTFRGHAGGFHRQGRDGG